MTPNLGIGPFAKILGDYPEGRALSISAGPVSDAFIMSNGTRDVLNGPVGSGKTTASIKRALRSAVEQPPLRTTSRGKFRRKYSLAVVRETYADLWSTTIKSWRKVLNDDAGIGTFTGSFPRQGRHEILLEDAFGSVEFTSTFFAFGDDADVESLGGTEYTDVYLSEINTMREDFAINVARALGREPNRGELFDPRRPNDPIPDSYLHGKLFGDLNAPDPLNWVYRDWFGKAKRGHYQLFRQPGGMHPQAENIAAIGRRYYEQMIEDNAHRQWWIKIKVHNEPGFNREMDIVYPDFVDSRHVSNDALKIFPEIPVMIGVDGGGTPAGAFYQQMPDGQVRIVAEVVVDRGDELDLARGINVVMASPRFSGCEFHCDSDPATHAGDDSTGGSWARRLQKGTDRHPGIGITVHKAPIANEDTEGRHRTLREKLTMTLRGDRPALVVDGVNCPAIRRGFNGTFHYHTVKGTGERGRIVKNPDSHVMEALEYASTRLGSAAASTRKSVTDQARRRRMDQARDAPRYDPFASRQT